MWLSRPGNWAPAFAGVAIAALLATSCGFQLRGDPSMGLKSLHVATVGSSGVSTEIKRLLATGPTKLVPTAKDAQANLRILGEGREKSVYTITGAGRVYEFQLRLAVRYELVVPGRELPVIATTEIEARARHHLQRDRPHRQGSRGAAALQGHGVRNRRAHPAPGLARPARNLTRR
jgi:hypothetical protein